MKKSLLVAAISFAALAAGGAKAEDGGEGLQSMREIHVGAGRLGDDELDKVVAGKNDGKAQMVGHRGHSHTFDERTQNQPVGTVAMMKHIVERADKLK